MKKKVKHRNLFMAKTSNLPEKLYILHFSPTFRLPVLSWLVPSNGPYLIGFRRMLSNARENSFFGLETAVNESKAKKIFTQLVDDECVAPMITLCFLLFLLDNCQRINAALLQSTRRLPARKSQPNARLNESALSDHESPAAAADIAFAVAAE